MTCTSTKTTSMELFSSL